MHTEENDNAPLTGKWSFWYIAVIGFLVMLIILFSLFTRAFS